MSTPNGEGHLLTTADGLLENQPAHQSKLAGDFIPAGSTAQALADALQPLVSRVRTENTAIKHHDGSSRWRDKEPLTPERLLEHVSSGAARGVCPMKRGETTTMLAVFDLDSHKGQTPWSAMRDIACELRDELEMWGFEVTSFRSSGGNGIHLMVLWDAPQDAYSVRKTMAGMLAGIGFTDGAAGVSARQIEVFPKQNEITATGFGNQFILPLAGKSVPLDRDMMPMPREAVIGMAWPTSTPVPMHEQSPRKDYAQQDSIESITDEQVADLRSALRHLAAAGLDDNYTGWAEKTGSALMSLGDAVGLPLFVEHSANCGNGKPGDAEAKWPALRADRTGYKAIFTRASAAGWPNPRAALPNTADGLPDVPVDIDALPAFTRRRDGAILPTISNLLSACRRQDVCGLRLGHDRFKDEVMLARPNTDEWRQFTDEDYTWLRDHLARGGFAEIAKEGIRDAVHAIAAEHAFDSAILWLESLQWDGTKRVETFLSAYAGALDTPYTRAVAAYLWTALAGRVLSPGCKADMAPVLVGAQGVRKSSLVKAMVPSVEHYAEVDLRDKDDDLSRRMRGRLIAELGELQGMGSREIESVKAFITRTHENWVPKFKEFATLFPRRLVFIGTTNKDQFLSDETGNRRWLPVRVETMCDPDAAARDCLQLWAEAAALFRAGGIRFQDAERLGQHEHADFIEIDAWCETIEAWLRSPDADAAAGVTTWQVACGALFIERRNFDRAKETRIGKALKTMGFARKRLRIGGVLTYLYARVPTVPT